MTDAERTKLLADKGWTCGPRNDGQVAVRDSSGNQIGVGESPDAAVAAAVEYGRPEMPTKTGKAEKDQ